MSTTLFPLIQPELSKVNTELPLFKEIKWDFENDVPVFKNGSPVFVTGKEAILVWIWNALKTERFKYEIYTWDYGNEVESLIGQPFTEELKQSEASRYIRECLLTNPYITNVSNISVLFADTNLTITCTVESIYGEVEVNV